MQLPRHTRFLRVWFATALPLLFLFLAVVPASVEPALAATPGSIIASQSCTPRVRPGNNVECTLTLTNLGTSAQDVWLTLTVAGGGLYPDTDFVIKQTVAVPIVNQLNRQQYRFGTDVGAFNGGD